MMGDKLDLAPALIYGGIASFLARSPLFKANAIGSADHRRTGSTLMDYS
jgi:hypothetical protein